MHLISKAAKSLRHLSFVLENPSLVEAKLIGGIPTLYRKLDTPWFYNLGVKTVIDIGANTGQFALTINKLLPDALIYSFEPIPKCFDSLKENMRKVSQFAGFNIGLGDSEGELEFEANEFSPSSSFLPMTDLHKSTYPFAKDKKLVTIKVDTLDHVSQNINISFPLLVKLDVQGYESKVMIGGEKVIRNASLVIVEVAFERLYQDQPLFDDIYQVLRSWGFSYMGAIEQVYHPDNKNILYADVIFIKKQEDRV